MKLNDDIQIKLRTAGKILESEIILKEGDLFVALNVLTQQRRIIKKDNSLIEILNLKTESSKRILKG